MSEKTPSTLERYFAAANQHDVNGMLAVFDERAVVKDEGEEHLGSLAIRDWIHETIRRYDFQVEPTAWARANGETVVTVRVSGRFPGSPVTLSYRFRFDGPRIARMEIG